MILNDFVQQVIKFVKREAPTLLTITASAGTVATAVVAVKSTRKIVKLEEDIMSQESTDEEKTHRYITEVVPLYFPMVTTTIVSVGCSILADILNINRINKLSRDLVLSTILFDSYRNIIRKEKGTEEEKKIYDQAVEQVPLSADEKVTFFDPRIQYTFETTWFNFMQAIYELNRQQVDVGETRMFDFYKNIPEIKIKDIPERAKVFGWNADMFLDSNIYWIDYGLTPIVSDKRKIQKIEWFIGPINLEYDNDGPWEAENDQYDSQFLQGTLW